MTRYHRHSHRLVQLDTYSEKHYFFLQTYWQLQCLIQQPDVNAVAESVHLSTAAFCRYFKKQTKMTFTDFVNQYRITQAKTLLLNDLSVSQACYEVGFESLSYFNKLFKKLTGENPSAFKRRQRQATNLPTRQG
jgi:AraC-like DNA-binding protein